MYQKTHKIELKMPILIVLKPVYTNTHTYLIAENTKYKIQNTKYSIQHMRYNLIQLKSLYEALCKKIHQIIAD